MALLCPDGTMSHGYFKSSPDDLKYDRHMGKDGVWGGMVVGERRGSLPRAFQALANMERSCLDDEQGGVDDLRA
jgi:hypothetical protein